MPISVKSEKEKKMMKNESRAEEKKSLAPRLFSFFGHLGSALIIFLSSLPFMKWFYSKSPVLGVDFYLMSSYVAYLKENFSFLWNGWKYNAFGGVPLFNDYPALHFYAALPFAHIWGVFRGTQIYLLLTLFLLLFFCYLLFYEVSRSRIISLLLTVGVNFSIAIYGALTYGGNNPYFATQWYLPLLLYLIVKFNKTKKRLFLVLSALFLGFSFLAQPGVSVYYLVPLSSILIFFWWDKLTPFISWRKIKYLVTWLLIGALIGGAIIYYFALTSGTSTLALKSKLSFIDIIFQRTPDYIIQLRNIVDPLLFVFPALFFIIFLLHSLFTKKYSYLKFLWPLFLIIVYSLFLIYNPFQWGGPWRIFWSWPIILGFIASIFANEFFEVIKEKFKIKKVIHYVISTALILAILIGSSFYFYSRHNYFMKEMSKETLSAHVKDKYTRETGSWPPLTRLPMPAEEMKEKIVPSWLDEEDIQHRMYAMDATFNMWWGSYFPIPLVRGYAGGATSPKLRNWLYWTDTSLTKNDIVELHNVPENIAKNYALFNIDWMAIKYLEGTSAEDLKERSITGRQYVVPLSTYLLDGLVMKRSEFWEKAHYFEVKDDFTSPLVKTTNVPAVLIIADSEGYDVILKNIAIHNYHSQYLIPIHTKRIDDLTQEEINNYEAIILYNYQYKDKKRAFSLLENYLQSGGSLYIETGSRSPEEKSKKLPDLFPIYATSKKAFGKNWVFEVNDDQLIEGVEFDRFSEASFHNAGWGVSYSVQKEIKDWAKIVLSIEDYPVMVRGQYGQGEIIWSGFNLPYHILSYNNEKEAKLFANILEALVSPEKEVPLDYSIERPRSERVIIEGKEAKGVLFKESYYPGWKAKIKNNTSSRRLKIMPAGIDFMYVRLPKDFQKDFRVEFTYRGTWYTWLFYLVSSLTVIYCLDYILLKSRLFNLVTGNLFVKRKQKRGLVKKIASWWNRDET